MFLLFNQRNLADDFWPLPQHQLQLFIMSQLTLEELELLDEPKYRNYINSVDKALKSFEYTSEWADLISALGKLNKVTRKFY